MLSNRNSDATLYINLEAIAHNYNLLKNKAKSAECGAVVKANAYGLGVEQVATRLFAEGCRKFFVATLDEALELRNILRKSEIYVFNGIRKGQEKEFLQYDITPVLNDIGQIELWCEYADLQGKQLPAIIHVDTGMNRLGLQFNETEKTLFNNWLLEKINVKYIMSHLACIGTPDNPKNKQQLKLFNKVRKLLPNVPASFANSGGIMAADCYHFDLVRPGSALYGLNSVAGMDFPLKNVVRLVSKIIQIRVIDTEGTVGYGATHKIAAGSKLAVVPVGYADGYLRSLSNKSSAFINDIEVPLVGRVSMDMAIFDISKVPSAQISPNTEIQIVGEKITPDMLAEKAGTIGYEILTSLGSRYKRVYQS